VVVGRGSSDAKGGIVSAVLALQRIAETAGKGEVGYCDIEILVVTDEEEMGLSARSWARLLAEEDRTSEAVVVEPTNGYWLHCGNLTALYFYLFHRSERIPRDVLERIRAELGALLIHRSSRGNGFPDGLVMHSSAHFSRIFGSQVEAAYTDFSLAEFPSVPLTVASNAGAMWATFFVLTCNTEVQPQSLARKVGGLLRAHQGSADVLVTDFHPRTMTDLASPLVRKFVSVLQPRICGYEESQALLSPSAGTDWPLRRQGIPTVVYGPGFPLLVHKPNESVSMSQVLLAADVLAEVAQDRG